MKRLKESGIEPTLIEDLMIENKVQSKKLNPWDSNPHCHNSTGVLLDVHP